jgi:hypothetical protein
VSGILGHWNKCNTGRLMGVPEFPAEAFQSLARMDFEVVLVSVLILALHY